MDFRDFIKSQLKIAKINQEHRESFTDPEGMKLFLAAVTHPTFDPENNYQELEFIGDGIIKGILSQYIPRRFPNTKSDGKKTGEGVLSKIRRYLEQRKMLSDFASKLGFWIYTRADEETKSRLRKETLEDVFEAFIGALTEIVDQRVKRGLGYNYAYNYLEASLNEISIEISQETLDDPITRLNELYKAKEIAGNKVPLKWGDAVYDTRQLYIPIFSSHPDIQSSNIGNLYFSSQEKVTFVFDGYHWINISKAPLIALKPFPTEIRYDENQRPKDMQSMWYAGVFGFPKKIGMVSDGRIIPANKILENPSFFGAEIIGQGLLFKKIDSKKIAANRALNYLKERGYYKL